MLEIRGLDNSVWSFSYDSTRQQHRVHARCMDRQFMPTKLMFTGTTLGDVLAACWEVRKTMTYRDIKDWEYHYV